MVALQCRCVSVTDGWGHCRRRDPGPAERRQGDGEKQPPGSHQHSHDPLVPDHPASQHPLQRPHQAGEHAENWLEEAALIHLTQSQVLAHYWGVVLHFIHRQGRSRSGEWPISLPGDRRVAILSPCLQGTMGSLSRTLQNTTGQRARWWCRKLHRSPDPSSYRLEVIGWLKNHRLQTLEAEVTDILCYFSGSYLYFGLLLEHIYML